MGGSRGKVDTAEQKLHSDVQSRCASVSSAFPGECDGLGGTALGDCLERLVECRACRMINIADGLDGDCDLFDDQQANGSCPNVTCPGEPGTYTITTVAGGTLKVSTFAPFSFPAGGTLIADVGEPDADCVHPVVVPFPGGFSAPTFCIPALGYTGSIAQRGCGVGLIDSDGGSDFTITEVADTSDSSATCSLPNAACTVGHDSSARIDVTVGDGTADNCNGGAANAVVSIPVDATVWLSADATCPDSDATYDPGTDTLITELATTLDATTDTATAGWADLDGDGCSLAGSGPTPLSGTGECLDVDGETVTIAAAAPIPSNALPFDITLSATIPAVVTGPGAPLGATCTTPPLVTLGGTATRCFP